MEAMLTEGEIVPELGEFILSRTGGNPLYMEELTRSLLENGSIEKKNHHYVLAKKASDIQVPDTVQGIIAARMDRLEDDLKQIMQVASVIGKDFGFRVLQTITGMREELKSHLLSLQGFEFIYEKRILPEIEYIFKHALIQEVAYNSLLRKRRKEIHENIGQALEQIYPERLEEFYEMLAHHYSKGQDSEKAYRYLKLSGEKAAKSHSLWEAFHFYREAINVLNRLRATEQNKKEQIAVRLLLTTPITLLGHPEDSLQILLESERLSKEISDERSLLVFQSKLGVYYSHHGEPLLAIEHTEKPFQEAKKTEDVELMAPIACELCSSYMHAGEFLKITSLVPEVLVILEKARREQDFFGSRYNVYSGLCAYCGYACGMLGDFGRGKTFLQKGAPFALEVHSIYGLGYLEFCFGQLFVVMGDGPNVIAHMEESIRYLEQAQAVFLLGAAWCLLGYGYCLSNEPETAKRYFEKGFKIHNDAGQIFFLSKLFWLLAVIHFDAGDLKSAQSHINKALRVAKENSEKHWEGCSRVWLGRISEKMGEWTPEKAEECIFDGIRLLDELKMEPFAAQGHLFLGELYSDVGRGEKGHENLTKAEEMFQQMGMDYWLIITREVLERF
jgi:tetratricopeptide (TPR) repeat protein